MSIAESIQTQLDNEHLVAGVFIDLKKLLKLLVVTH